MRRQRAADGQGSKGQCPKTRLPLHPNIHGSLPLLIPSEVCSREKACRSP
jgi:hypothetical protein